VSLRVVVHGERDGPDPRDRRRPEVGAVERVVGTFVFEQLDVSTGRPLLLGEVADRGNRSGLVDSAREEADRAAHQRPVVDQGTDRGVERKIRAELRFSGACALSDRVLAARRVSPPPRDRTISAIRPGSTLGWVARSARARYTSYTCPMRLSSVSDGNLVMPRPVKLSTTNTATPCDRSSRAQRSPARS